jgi:hypothetical protein
MTKATLEPWSAERKGISIYFTPFILQIRIPRPRREAAMRKSLLVLTAAAVGVEAALTGSAIAQGRSRRAETAGGSRGRGAIRTRATEGAR